MFNTTGNVKKNIGRNLSPRWPDAVREYVEGYVQEHPCFYLEELQQKIQDTFPSLQNVSLPSICRALRHDLNLTRKKIEKRAREAAPHEVKDFKARLQKLYQYPEQLIFVDETSKDTRASIRQWAWSQKGTPAIVSLPFSRGKRVSVLAAFNSNGFVAWAHTPDTFTRQTFHSAFVQTILPHLRPWPGCNSIVIIDNARIHIYRQLEEAIASVGAYLCFLPPYSPHLNPIEVGFALVKKWIAKNANIVYRHQPHDVLDLAFKKCASKKPIAVNLYSHCGYDGFDLQNIQE